jgi:glucose/arabinose dehydrogenase
LGSLIIGLAASCRCAEAPSALGSEDGRLPLTDTSGCTPRSGVGLVLRPLLKGLDRPVQVLAPAGDARLFVLEQPGRVLVAREGVLLKVPFLDISDKLTSRSNEQGLLGMVFHPRFPEDPRFFVNYSEAGSGATVIAEYRVDPAKPDRALAAERRILRVEQPFANHNAGGLAFSPKDGFLYVGLGDGGAGGDPQGNGQNSATLLGSMLRLDVDSERAHGYAIPKDNPGAVLAVWGGKPAPELWAMGLRNPWRFSFDPVNSDLYIGDVGQNAVEEIHWVPGSSGGGENYGWNIREGDACYSSGPDCALAGRTDPVYTAKARRPCNSITGGYVYRGRCLPDLVGRYVFGDYCHDTVLSFEMKDGIAVGFADMTPQLDPRGSLISGLSSFGLDGFGELYVVSHRGGVVYRIEADGGETK